MLSGEYSRCVTWATVSKSDCDINKCRCKCFAKLTQFQLTYSSVLFYVCGSSAWLCYIMICVCCVCELYKLFKLLDVLKFPSG